MNYSPRKPINWLSVTLVAAAAQAVLFTLHLIFRVASASELETSCVVLFGIGVVVAVFGVCHWAYDQITAASTTQSHERRRELLDAVISHNPFKDSRPQVGYLVAGLVVVLIAIFVSNHWIVYPALMQLVLMASAYLGTIGRLRELAGFNQA